MLIVLDTNIIIRDRHLEGATFRSLLDAAKSVGAQLCIPRCVLVEAQEHFREALREAADQLDKAAESVARLLQRDIPATIVADPAAEAAKYGAWLEGKFKDAGGIVMDYPSFSSDEIVQRAAKHRKPFAAKGDQGLKDYLIWKTVLGLAKESRGQVALVTTNSKDFSDGQGALHPDLLADLDSAEIPRDRVTFRGSLDAILTTSITPALQEVKEMEEQLKSGTFRGLSLEEWIGENLAEGIEIKKVHDLHWAMNWEFEDAVVGDIYEIASVDVTDVRRLPSGEFLIEVATDVEAEVSYSYTVEEEVSEWNWAPRDMSGMSHVRMSIGLLLTFDPKEASVTSWDVVEAYAIPGKRARSDRST